MLVVEALWYLFSERPLGELCPRASSQNLFYCRGVAMTYCLLKMAERVRNSTWNRPQTALGFTPSSVDVGVCWEPTDTSRFSYCGTKILNGNRNSSRSRRPLKEESTSTGESGSDLEESWEDW